jgi:hypothetical protein
MDAPSAFEEDTVTANWTLTLLLALSVNKGSLIDAKLSSQQPKPVLNVVVRDLIGMDPSSQNVARAETVRIMKEAGIELRWIDATATADPTLSFSMKHYVTIVVTAQPLNGQTTVHAMGFAPVRTGPYPRAYVFSTLVNAFLQKFKIESRSSFGIVLGHAIAHELGHLVIPGEAHGQGIMKPYWGYQEWQEALEGSLLFAPHHAQALRKALQSK